MTKINIKAGEKVFVSTTMKNLKRVEMAMRIKRAHSDKKIFLTQEGLKKVDRVIGLEK